MFDIHCHGCGKYLGLSDEPDKGHAWCNECNEGFSDDLNDELDKQIGCRNE